MPEGISDSYSYVNLILKFPDDFSGFDLNAELKKFHKNENLRMLTVDYPSLKVFPESIFDFKSLRLLEFERCAIDSIPDNFDKFKMLYFLKLPPSIKNLEDYPKTVFYNDTLRLKSLRSLFINNTNQWYNFSSDE